MLIGELAAVGGTTAKALRFYEDAGLLPEPERTAGGYRDYPAAAVSRLHFIRRGRAAGLTLAQIRGILELRDAGDAPCAHVRELLAARVAELDRQLAELRALRDTVAGLADAAARVDPSSCEPEDICRYL